MSRINTVVIIGLLLVPLVLLPVLLLVMQKRQEVRTQATDIPPELVIDVASQRPLPRIWNNLAQGGEVPLPQFPGVVPQLAELHPAYIRLDHVFDSYQVVKQGPTGLVYDFSTLDKEVNAVIAAGATPLLSLSYVPSEIAQAGNPERPDYDKWSELIFQTVRHYSGKSGKNLQNVMYEVYNEPDLFGKWTKDEYLALYKASVTGASRVPDAHPYQIGGPALTHFDLPFMKGFLEDVSSQSLRIDFLSWHSYSTDPATFSKDRAQLAQIALPLAKTIPVVITEWGSRSEKHVWHDTQIDASHTIAGVSAALGLVDKLFAFELKDGQHVGDNPFSGGWGVLTHEANGAKKKPRYEALLLLNTLKPQQFATSGVIRPLYAIASGDSATNLRILSTNYPATGAGKVLTVPVTLTSLPPGQYHIKQTLFDGRYKEQPPATLIARGGQSEFSFDLPPESIMALDITRTSAATAIKTLATGRNAAVLSPLDPPLWYEVSKTSGTTLEITLQLSSETPWTDANATLFESKGRDGRSIRVKQVMVGFALGLQCLVEDASGSASFVSAVLPPNFPVGEHTVTVAINNQTKALALRIDGTTTTAQMITSATLGEDLQIGAASGESVALPLLVSGVSVSVDAIPLISESF